MQNNNQNIAGTNSLPTGEGRGGASVAEALEAANGKAGLFLHYLKIAFRGLFRYKWQNLVCIAGLIVGLTAFVLGGYWWHWEHHFDDFHPNASRIYGITTTGIGKAADGSARELDQLHRDDANWMLENIPEIERFTHTGGGITRMTYSHEGRTENLLGLSVDSVFFSLFYSAFIDGGYKYVPFDGSHIVLTERTAMKYFGKIDCTGEAFPGGDKRVAGVIRNYPSNSGFRFDYLLLTVPVYNPAGRAVFYVQLIPQAKVDDVRQKIENHRSVAQTRNPGEEKNWSFNLRSLPELHLYCNPDLKSRFRNIRLLAVAGLLALVSSLMNCLALFIGQQQKRQRRNTTFRSMGASTSYLFKRSLADLILPLVLAVAASAYLIRFLFPLYQTFTQLRGGTGIYENFVNMPELNAMLPVAIRWTGLILAVFLLSGSLLIAGMLRRTGRQTPRMLRRSLIAGQVFIGSFFLFIALSLYRQFHFTQHRDKGIRVENIFQISSGAFSGFDNRTMREELLRSPYIDDVTFTTMPVLTEQGDFYVNYMASITSGEDRFDGIWTFLVEQNFLDFFGMKMKEGEWITGEKDLVVNEMQMQAFGGKELLGETVRTFGLGEAKLSGVMQNYNYSTMQYPIAGLMFCLNHKEFMEPYRNAYIKTKPENREMALAHVQQVLDAQQTLKAPEDRQILPLSGIMDELSRPERTLSLIFGLLSLACILVVAFGIYSLISLTIEQRRREIAIRKINGAEYADMLRLFFREYLLLVIAGNAFALTPGYYMMQRWFETYVYRTTLGWWMFAAVFVTTGVIVFLSVVSKISEAAKVDPADALKYE